jgi:hypothetical protein
MANSPYIVRNEQMRERVIGLLQQLDLSKPWEVRIQRHQQKRTLSQNALYWKWINEVADIVSRETGQDSDDIHEFFKAKFLPSAGRKVVEIGGETVERRTTRALDTKDMARYMEAIEGFVVSELGILLPAPPGTEEQR